MNKDIETLELRLAEAIMAERPAIERGIPVVKIISVVAPLAGLLGKILRPSDHCFDGFISPMTNPVFFEDPRTLTEARVIFAHHNIPAAIAGGGDVQLYAMQVRLALTERLSFIATKDGYIVSSNPVIRDGWADIAAGLKYNLIRDVARQRLLSVGATFELPVGSPRAFQGNGDGEFNLFYSGARRMWENFNWISGGGIRIPSDDDAESSSTYMSQHFDVRMTERTYLLTEVNWFHWYDSGANALLNTVEGHDLFNFGSTNVDGNDLVTMAFGGKLKPNRNSELGIAYEVPVSGRQDVTTNRLTVDMILRY